MVPLYSGAYGKTSIGTCRGCRAGRPGKVPENNRSVIRNRDSNPPLFSHSNCALISWASLTRSRLRPHHPKESKQTCAGSASTGSPASAPVKRGDVELQNSSREACGIPVVVIPGQERGEVNHYDPHAREKMVNRYACLFREREVNNRTIYPG